MEQSQHFMENAENCAQLAERAPTSLPIGDTSAWKRRGAH